ncbi:MAG: type II secretion system F family protein [Methanomassiliicoccales archaeon]|nr:MAG: type II secretion system F family protein [Methanomassiliicoccales archaeon]
MSPEVQDSFKALETSKRGMVVTKKHEEDYIEEFGPHLIKLPKGAAVQQIKLTPYQQFCWRTMGNFVKRRGKVDPKLEEALQKAHMRIRPDEYSAYALMTTLLTFIGMLVVGIFIGFIFMMIELSIFGLLIGALVIVFVPVVVYFGIMSSPSGKAKARGKDIDRRISSAMSFISAMASANVNVDVIFKELAKQPIYGEIQKEAEWITRDTELLGQDILSAIKSASLRTPSIKFQDFLQGVVTTSSSGGELKPFFLIKAKQYEDERRLDLRARIETLGMLAESFVTVGVAFPLFLVVMMSIMALVGSSPDFILMLLYVVCFGMIPGTQVGFIVGISSMSE